MKTTLASLILLAVIALNTFAQDTSRWGLPEGAKARLGGGRVFDLKYSPDGTRLAAASSIGVWLYDSATGDPVGLLRDGNSSRAVRVAFGSDGRTLFAAADDTIFIWDAVTGELRHTVRAGFGSAGYVAFSGDGRTIASRDGDVVRLWDAETGELKHTRRTRREEHFGDVRSLALSPDGRTLATGHRSLDVGHSERDGIVRLWEATTGELQYTFSAGISRPTSLAFSPDGRTLAVGHLDWAFGFGSWGWTTLRDAATGQFKHLLRGHDGDGVDSIAYSADGGTLASGSHLGKEYSSNAVTVRIWDAATGAQLSLLKAYVWEVYSLALSPDGGTVAVAGSDGRLSLWDTAAGTLKRQVEGHSGRITSVAFSPDGGTVATATRGRRVGWDWRWAGTVRLWDAAAWTQQIALEGHTDGIASVAFSPDGRTLASGSWDRTARLWDAATGENFRTLDGHTGVVNSVAFSPDGLTLASAGGEDDETVRLWHAATGSHGRTLDGYNKAIISVSFSPDGTTLAGVTSGVIRLWEVEKEAFTHTLLVSSGNFSLHSIAFSPDGGTLAAGGWDAIHLWDAATGAQRPSLDLHESRDTIVAYSPDGYTLASGSIDNTVRLSDVATGEHLRTLEGHTGDVNSVAFSPDGHTLASGSNDGTVLLWEIIPVVDEPSQVTADVNGDGVVEMLDLVWVAGRIGDSVESRADVNRDGIVNILDLVLVAGRVDNAAGTPLMDSRGTEMLRTTEVKTWLEEARRLALADITSLKGIEYLANLLEALTPERTRLLPNFPNPFNPETWIPYHLARESVVRISIYSSKGILVRQLDLGLQAQGYYTDKHHAAYWDGRNDSGELLASGVYVYVFQAGSYRASLRVAIVR